MRENKFAANEGIINNPLLISDVICRADIPCRRGSAYR